jgi:hypothetical protein
MVTWAARCHDGELLFGTRYAWHVEFRNWLFELVEDCRASAILLVDSRAASNEDLLHDVARYCERTGVRCVAVLPGAIKKFAAGSGSAPKSAVVTAVQALGYQPTVWDSAKRPFIHPETEDEAMAIALLLYAEAERATMP